MPLETQLGVKAESTWGTAVVVDRFYEFNSESITLETGRVESNALRASQRVQRSDRFTPYILGASGSIEMDVLSKGFGWWLEQCLGTIATGSLTDSTYTHTGTVGTLLAQGFTLQVNRPFHPAGTNQAFTYEGGKVAKWGFKSDVEGNLVFTADLVFETGITATALATASYPTGMENLTWAGGAVTVGGSAVPVTSFSVEVDNGQDTARHKIRSSTLRQEPVEAKNREITFSTHRRLRVAHPVQPGDERRRRPVRSPPWSRRGPLRRSPVRRRTPSSRSRSPRHGSTRSPTTRRPRPTR
jgi:hypothetical protein